MHGDDEEQEINPSYNPGKVGRTWDDQFRPDSAAPRFYAEVDASTHLVVEFDEGWHLWQITLVDGEARDHHHLAGPFQWFPDIQEKAVEAFDRIADEKAESNGEPTVNQTFNIGESDQTDALVMYGVPRHVVDDPAELRAHLLTLHAKQHRLCTALAKLYPLAKAWADELSAFEGAANADAENGKYDGRTRDQARKNANLFGAKVSRFKAAEAAMLDLGIPLRDRE